MFLRAHITLPSNSREELYRSLQIKNSQTFNSLRRWRKIKRSILVVSGESQFYQQGCREDIYRQGIR